MLAPLLANQWLHGGVSLSQGAGLVSARASSEAAGRPRPRSATRWLPTQAPEGLLSARARLYGVAWLAGAGDLEMTCAGASSHAGQLAGGASPTVPADGRLQCSAHVGGQAVLHAEPPDTRHRRQLLIAALLQ